MSEQKPHSELVERVRWGIQWAQDPSWEGYDEADAALDELVEQFDALRVAATEYLEHTEDSDYRRGHTNTACPPLTRAMCGPYMRLRAVLYPAKRPT